VAVSRIRTKSSEIAIASYRSAGGSVGTHPIIAVVSITSASHRNALIVFSSRAVVVILARDVCESVSFSVTLINPEAPTLQQ
jgi:hypothetical protein